MYAPNWLPFVTTARKVRRHVSIPQQYPNVISHPPHAEQAYNYWPKSAYLVSRIFANFDGNSSTPVHILLLTRSSPVFIANYMRRSPMFFASDGLSS